MNNYPLSFTRMYTYSNASGTYQFQFDIEQYPTFYKVVFKPLFKTDKIKNVILICPTKANLASVIDRIKYNIHKAFKDE